MNGFTPNGAVHDPRKRPAPDLIRDGIHFRVRIMPEKAVADPSDALLDRVEHLERRHDLTRGSAFHFLENRGIATAMIVVGTEIVGRYFTTRPGHQGIKAARSQYDVWFAIAARSEWRNPEDVKRSHPKASILKDGRVVFNIKGNDFRLVAALNYRAGVLAIRFFGTHAEYDKIDAETV
jgi:mRNA interferase HigB